MTQAPTRDNTHGADGIVVGAGVHIEAESGTSWPGHITFISDRIVGVRGYSPVDRQFRIRDQVTVNVGHGDDRVSSRAQVLAADGSLLRLVRRDDSDQERRHTPRLPVEIAAAAELPTGRVNVELIELSSAGCTLRSGEHLRVGTPLRIAVSIGSGPLELDGIVVRSWTAHTPPAPHSGIQFDPPPTATAQLLARFLSDQFRAA